MAERKPTAVKESVVSRWSRRKIEAEQAASETELATAEDVAAKLDPLDAEEMPALTDADMPDVETLTEESDFTGFMSPGVSDKLRNIALRKLFHAPVFNIRDGLDEYDEDYTSFEKLGDIVTCDMKHQMEVQEQKLREALELEQEQEQAAIEDAELDDVEAIEEVDDEIVDADVTDEENHKQASLDTAADDVARKDVVKKEKEHE